LLPDRQSLTFSALSLQTLLAGSSCPHHLPEPRFKLSIVLTQHTLLSCFHALPPFIKIWPGHSTDAASLYGYYK
jgi:hypothetical protein